MRAENKHKLLSIVTVLLLTCIVTIIRCFNFDIWNNERIYVIGCIIFLACLSIFVMVDKLEWNDKNSIIFVAIWVIAIMITTLSGLTGINEWIPYYIPTIIIAVMYGQDSGFCYNLFSGAYLCIIWYFGNGEAEVALLIKLLLIGTIFIISLSYMKNLTQIVFTGMSIVFAIGIVNILYYNLILDKVYIKALLAGFLITTFTYLIGFIVSIWKRINYKEKTSSFEMADELCNEEFNAIKSYKEKAIASYEHSVSVSELACIAASKVDADIGIIRVGSMYHEIGKSENPADYVNEGILICDKHGLPDYVKDIITEHCLKIRNPQSIESAIIMLADSIINSIDYARANNQNIDNKKVIENVIKVRLDSGALDDCNITVEKLNKIKKAFLNAYL